MSPDRRVRGCAVVAALLGGLAACGDDGVTPADAAIDAAPGECGAEAPLSGEIVDWDASNTAFCGVFNARLTVRGGSAASDTTNPNGRFELCIPREAQSVIDIAFSATPSECTTPKETYPVPAVLVLDQGSGMAAAPSVRAMTATRQAAMFTQIGAPYDAAQAQLVVHLVGESGNPISISSAHAATQAFNGTTWQAGDAGRDVLFPNVAPGATQVSVAGRTLTLTLAAGVYTHLTLSTRLSAAPAR